MMKVPGGTPERTLGPKRRLKCATVPAAKTETSEARPTGTKSAVPIHARGREVPIGPRTRVVVVTRRSASRLLTSTFLKMNEGT